VLVLGAGVAGAAGDRDGARLGARRHRLRRAPGRRRAGRVARRAFLDLGIEASRDRGRLRARADRGGARRPSSSELEEAIAGFDVVITTALRPRPQGADADHRRGREGMKPGSVIVDLAGETGGNCELTEPGETSSSTT
jgi:NAD(P) transhydrogenase subunit alpha